MLKVLKEREYDPDDAETLLAAFKVALYYNQYEALWRIINSYNNKYNYYTKLLDPENKGYIE